MDNIKHENSNDDDINAEDNKESSKNLDIHEIFAKITGEKIEEETQNLFIDKNFNVNFQDKNKETLLHLLAKFEYIYYKGFNKNALKYKLIEREL